MVNTLHEQLLAAVAYEQSETQSWMGEAAAETMAAALRAVVELHAPDAFGDCSAPCFDSSENPQRHPCETIEVVASALGVETAEGQDRAGS